MRILHLDTGRELRGGQRQLFLLSRGLAQLGHDQVILARAEFATLPLTPLNLAREAHRADVIHAHDARAHTLATLVPRGPTLVVSRRVAFPVRAGVLSRWKYRRAARYLAVSEFVKARLLEAGVDENRISVVYDGMEAIDRQPPAERGPHVLAPATG
ncbi:MAG: glycosyltransferase, partial [Acidobacteria bacterium]|nr:glycosyltransferase [Acidobacteriota bacterium]